MQIKSSTQEFDCCNFSALCVQRALSSSRVKERHKYSLLHIFPSTLFRNVISDLAEPPSSRPPVSFLFGFCLRKKNPITFCFPTRRLSPCFRRFRLIVFCCCYRVSNPPPPHLPPHVLCSHPYPPPSASSPSCFLLQVFFSSDAEEK